MKNKSLKTKFKNNVLVKPLYRKVNPKDVLVSVHSTYNLDGYNFHVKREISDVQAKVNQSRRTQDSILPGACEAKCSKTVINKVYNIRGNEQKEFKMLESAGNSKYNDGNGNGKMDKFVQAEKHAAPHQVTDTWLRVYPLPQLKKESVCSIVFRCVACQIGLASILVLWTVLWLFVIHLFEGPYEVKVTLDFEREQNQLVIDLATELRQAALCNQPDAKAPFVTLGLHHGQITPLSPKWREAIERRIQEEKQLTIIAVGRGARAHPGLFWDLPGTFLFMVYVMTALGFGAPVPQTLWGRSAALIYAFIAVPTHIYLMVNASTCAVTKCWCRCPLKSKNTRYSFTERNTNNTKESPSCSRSSDVLKTSKCSNIRRKIMRCLGMLGACRCVPVAAILYFACGAVAFGVLRGRSAVETVMFPLEFTTTGGLEHVLGHVRILYGFYVEGAMVLIACGLAALRRRSNAAVNLLADKYRLFQVV